MSALPSLLDSMQHLLAPRVEALTIREIQKLRAQQSAYLRISEQSDIRQSARDAAAREVARIEAQIRGC